MLVGAAAGYAGNSFFFSPKIGNAFSQQLGIGWAINLCYGSIYEGVSEVNLLLPSSPQRSLETSMQRHMRRYVTASSVVQSTSTEGKMNVSTFLQVIYISLIKAEAPE